MQTFLAYPNFSESLKCLDYRRLGKQRVEAHQILTILEKLQEDPYQKNSMAKSSSSQDVGKSLGCFKILL